MFRIVLWYSITMIALFSFGAAEPGPEPVIGGSTAVDLEHQKIVRTDFPYVVRLIVKGEDKRKDYPIKTRMCGGVIVRSNALLTAAHCLAWSVDRPEILVTAGLSDLNLEVENGQHIFMRDYLIHEKFVADDVFRNGSRIHMQHDIAIVWIKKYFDFDDNVLKAGFIFSDVEIENKTGYILGWGESDNDLFPRMLQKGELRIISQENCMNLYPGINFIKGMMCAVSDTNKTMFCTSDAGGPFVVDNKVAALMSFNSLYYKNVENETDARCDPTKPAVLTNLKEYRSWIGFNLQKGAPKDREDSIDNLSVNPCASSVTGSANSVFTGLLFILIPPLIFIVFSK